MVAMISQPMRGLTDTEIKGTRDKAVDYLNHRGYEIIDNIFNPDDEIGILKDSKVFKNPVFLLGRSIEVMAHCDTVYFCKGWREARGCRIEHEVAKAYGLVILYE